MFRSRRSSRPTTVRRGAARGMPERRADGLLLQGERLTKSFNALLVLDEVDFSVRAREAVGVVGPNGAGKTTLLSVLVGAHAPTSGRVRFLGEDVTGVPTAERCRRGAPRTPPNP